MKHVIASIEHDFNNTSGFRAFGNRFTNRGGGILVATFAPGNVFLQGRRRSKSCRR